MELTLSTSLMRGSLSEKIAQARDAGFCKIDINVMDIKASELSINQIAKELKAREMGVGTILPLYDFEGYEGEAKCAAFKRLQWHLDIARALNASNILIGASTDARASVEHDLLAEDLHQAAKRAEKYGLKIAYLALPWSLHIHDTIAAWDMVGVVDHPSFGLAMNSYFALADGSKSARFRDVDGKKVFILQLADAPYSEFDITYLKHEFACLPGLGDLNLVSFLKTMEQIGYEGDISLARMGRSDEAHRARAKDGYRALSNLVDLTRVQLPEFHSELAALPSRAYAKGVEFLEFAVDEASGNEARALLKSLCFRCERRHKTKPVELWRQGAINIVLNQAKDGYAHQSLMSNGAGLCDMGLRVDDAGQTVARASALGVKAVNQPVGTGELEIPAIEGIGHSLIHFIDEHSNLHHVWEIEFDRQPENKITAPAGLRRIDHIAQTMASDELDSWLLFYLSVFEMKKSPLVDVPDPSGLVYSRAVESPEGELRLNLNGASSQHTFSGAFLADRIEAGAQHIAFTTDDIFETAQRLAQTGFEPLAIGQNYYDALAIEFDLEADMVEKLRSLNILYSRDSMGEYFQLYSQSIWGGFFIEIVERNGRYSGYGARNAPIRLAAQSRQIDPKNG